MFVTAAAYYSDIFINLFMIIPEDFFFCMIQAVQSLFVC